MTDEYILSNLLANILGLDASFASRFSDDPKYLYTTALTYEEQLLWFCSYINISVIHIF